METIVSIRDNESVCWDAAERLLDRVPLSLASLTGKTIAITGSTGLIGSHVVRALLCANAIGNYGIKLILPVRNETKARRLFGNRDEVVCYRWQMDEPLIFEEQCDHFLHAACGTSSKDFLLKPTETALEIINGVSCCLKAAYESGCESFVFLSTMEVYGKTRTKPIGEADLGYLDPMNPRNSYPLAKLLSENLVSSYEAEFGMRTTILRLTQTFGVGVRSDDDRVFAEFARCARSGTNISLFSDGQKCNCYLSVNDATTAIITVMLNQNAKGVYNAANPDTYCSILEMAEFVLAEFGADGSAVVFRPDPVRSKSFRESNDVLLDISHLRSLGWMPKDNLKAMYEQLLASWK